MRFVYIGIYILFSIFIILAIRGCIGFGNTSSINLSDKTQPISINEFNYWDGGANPEITAKMGGEEFNSIAKSLGYKTSTIKPCIQFLVSRYVVIDTNHISPIGKRTPVVCIVARYHIDGIGVRSIA